MKGKWRAYSAPIISRVIEENKGQDEKTVRAALRDAYPFGERAMHPYKIWCDEVNRQLGAKKPMDSKKAAMPDPKQTDLFTLTPNQ